jgi:hypothetical protein
MAAIHAPAPPLRLRTHAVSVDGRLVAAVVILVALAGLGLVLALSLPSEPTHAPISLLGPTR